MTRDPFLRLALIVSVTAYAVALAVVWRQLGWAVGLAGLVAGVPGAAVLTLERDQPEPPPADRPDPGRFRRGPQP